MENTERALIEGAITSNSELRRLYSKHRTFEEKIDKMGRRPYLTPKDQLEFKRLKAEKLRGVERMLQLIAA
jgi:hypothetical protein